MTSFVEINQRDLETLIEITELILEYKEKALSKISWNRFEEKYLPSVVESLQSNKFKHVRSDNNIAIWWIDQICHSRKIISGVKHNEGIPLIDTAIGQEAVRILRAMSKGQISYNQFRSGNNFNDLFESNK